MLAGAIAGGVNTVAGGGSLISFPYLTVGMRIPSDIANATNSVALWPGALAGAFGFRDHLSRTGKYFRILAIPTIIGSAGGAFLLNLSNEQVFGWLVPFLILIAALLLLLQQKIKQWALGPHRKSPLWLGVLLQTLVAIYGGYFGAGMGIMMLAAFALYMEGDIHELNAVKNWVGVLINLTASIMFLASGMVLLIPAAFMTVGSIVGGFLAAKTSQRVDPEKMRLAIGIYGLLMAVYFFYRAIS